MLCAHLALVLLCFGPAIAPSRNSLPAIGMIAGDWIGTQTCTTGPAGCDRAPQLDQKLSVTADGGGTFQGSIVLRVTELAKDGNFATGRMDRKGSDFYGTYMLQANATALWGSWLSWAGSEKLFLWSMKRAGPPPPPPPPKCPCGPGPSAGTCILCKPPPAVVLSPPVTVFDNSDYPKCCAVAMDPSKVCMYRIPVVLQVPQTPVVLAFAEARLGKVFRNSSEGCSDGSGPGLAMKRSTNYGRDWGPTIWIANDTEPLHVKLNDYIVLGVSLFDQASKTAFFFYTACCEWDHTFSTQAVCVFMGLAVHRLTSTEPRGHVSAP